MPERRGNPNQKRGTHEGALSSFEAELPAESRLLRFSFRHLDRSKGKFSYAACNLAFHQALLQSLQEYSTWSIERFTDQNNNVNRHIIDFKETTEPNGFTSLDPDQLGAHEAWQFALVSDKHWRVHGILLDDVFYVVWLDPGHVLYSSR